MQTLTEFLIAVIVFSVAVLLGGLYLRYLKSGSLMEVSFVRRLPVLLVSVAVAAIVYLLWSPSPSPTPTNTPTLTPSPTPTSLSMATSTPTSTPTTECPFTAPFRLPIVGPSVDVEASITSMDNCSDNLPTSTSIPLGGTYSGDMTNKELWILVYPPGPSYYPQSTDACRSLSTQFRDGYWTDTIVLGRPGLPEVFHIVLVVTEIGSPASDAFHGYLDRGCVSGDYWGLNLIPGGATELDSIIVHTR
jgi:hypothetical protein